MQRFYSELIGLPIYSSSSNSPITLIKDLIIDPETGKLLAFYVRNNRIVVPMDVENLGSALVVEDRDRILPIDDVLRVKEVAKMNMRIIGSKVFSQMNKIFLGRVVDYEIDTTHMVLTKIHVAKIFIFFHLNERIFSQKQIVKIEKKKIIVRDNKEILVKEKAAARPEAFAA